MNLEKSVKKEFLISFWTEEKESSFCVAFIGKDGKPVDIWLDKKALAKSPTSYFQKFFMELLG